MTSIEHMFGYVSMLGGVERAEANPGPNPPSVKGS